jgi:hypothetical protein
MCQQVSGCALDAQAAEDWGVELWRKSDFGNGAELTGSGSETKWEMGMVETVDVRVYDRYFLGHVLRGNLIWYLDFYRGRMLASEVVGIGFELLHRF